MRVEIADQLRAAAAGGLVCGDQSGGIDLEMAGGFGVDIGGDVRRFDVAGSAKQEAAGFVGGGLRGGLQNGGVGGGGQHHHVQSRRRGGRRQTRWALAPPRPTPHIAATMGACDTIIEGTIPAGGLRLDRALADVSGLSRERIKALMDDGRVALAGKTAAQASLKPAAGTPFTIRVPEAVPAAAAAQDIPLSVVYEDAHLIVVDKPAGLVVHPAAGNPDGTLVNALLHHCAGQLSGIGGVARPGIVHRIDKDTSGLLVVAKTDAAHEGLAKQFADHSIHRVYKAVTTGVPVPASGTVRGAIGRSDRDRKKMALVSEGPNGLTRGKHAVTHYRTIEVLSGAALVECRLETGRTHQVRVHLASIGHALVGDPVYGRTAPQHKPLLARLGFRRQALHAAELGFIHPASGELVRFASPTPVDLRTLIVELGGRGD